MLLRVGTQVDTPWNVSLIRCPFKNIFVRQKLPRKGCLTRRIGPKYISHYAAAPNVGLYILQPNSPLRIILKEFCVHNFSCEQAGCSLFDTPNPTCFGGIDTANAHTHDGRNVWPNLNLRFKGISVDDPQNSTIVGARENVCDCLASSEVGREKGN